MAGSWGHCIYSLQSVEMGRAHVTHPHILKHFTLRYLEGPISKKTNFQRL